MIPDWMKDFYIHTLHFNLPCNRNMFYIRPYCKKWSVMQCQERYSNVKDFLRLLQKRDYDLESGYESKQMEEELNDIRRHRLLTHTKDGVWNWDW
ncbi:hypothetical protein LCGC14_1719160 [marine sediment metagenome]|uniref:Uncharacterized protein n=1 Tax=marine sediment metagenome TaxID=412755 RepID=A0A0F9HD99_9ZZZZ